MERLYGSIVPRDLLLELSLYLNYRDVWLLSGFDKNICFTPPLWINKIRKELKFPRDFIYQYVYDSVTKQTKTLLPINEKYLELKSRNKVDFESNHYKNIDVLIYRTSRLKDYQLAKELTDYYLDIYGYHGDLIFRVIAEGATSVGNLDLVYYMIQKTLDQSMIQFVESSNPEESFENFGGSLMAANIIQGYYEAPKALRKQINLAQFNITTGDIEKRKREIVLGLTAGNHLDELKTYDAYIRSRYGLLKDMALVAVEANSLDVIKFYKLLQQGNREQLIRRAINYGHIIDDSQVAFIENGYLELIDFAKLEDIEADELKSAFMNALYYNHIDMANALYESDPEFYSKNIFKYNPHGNLNNTIPATDKFVKKLYPLFRGKST